MASSYFTTEYSLYEHTFNNGWVADVLLPKTASFNDFIFEANSKPAFYFNVGISYNPFGKPRQK